MLNVVFGGKGVIQNGAKVCGRGDCVTVDGDAVA